MKSVFRPEAGEATDAVPTRVCTLIVTAGKGCCWRRGDPGTLLHTPQHPGWPRAESADGQERGLGSWVAPRPELRDLHQLPCFFHSGSDRSPRRCWVRRGGGPCGRSKQRRETPPRLSGLRRPRTGAEQLLSPRSRPHVLRAGDSDQKCRASRRLCGSPGGRSQPWVRTRD